jgi:hypothetical protein
LLARKCGLTCVFTNGFWYFIWKILTESHPKARLTLFRNTRYNSEQSTQATRLYHEIAIKNGLTLTELSLAFIEQQPFVTSTIIGATTVEQLKENIDTIQGHFRRILKRLMQYKQQFQIRHRINNPVRVLKSDRVILNIKDQIHLQRLKNPLLLVLNLVL